MDPKNHSSTLLITIRVSAELLTLAEESKIGFLKRMIFYMPKKTLKTFPIPIRELYHKPNIIIETFKRYHGVFSHKNKYAYKWLQLRNCIKNCANSSDIIGFMPKPYPYGWTTTRHYERGYCYPWEFLRIWQEEEKKKKL